VLIAGFKQRSEFGLTRDGADGAVNKARAPPLIARALCRLSKDGSAELIQRASGEGGTMRRVLLTAMVVAVVISFTVPAQSRPDFSGMWTRDSAKSDSAPQGGGSNSHTIKQTATEIAVTIAGRGGPETSIYKLDGSESTNQAQSPEGSLTVKGTARWEGASLVIETRREIRGITIMTKEVRTLDTTGKEMTIEAITRLPQGEIKRKVAFIKS
jgi:hypothetical protein